MNPVRLTDYAACEAALKNSDLRQALYDAGSILMQDVLVNLHGDAHRQRRGVEGQLFRRSFFRQLEKDILPALVNQTLERELTLGDVDLRELSYRLMLHLSLLFTGIDRVRGTDEESAHLGSLLVRLGQAATLGQYQGDEKAAILADIEAAMATFDADYFQPSKARRLAAIEAAVASGRPTCELCGFPKHEDHVCPRSNGHGTKA